MNAMMIIYIVIGFCVGLAIGVLLMMWFSPSYKKQRALRKELDEAKLTLSTQKQFIFKHFSQSAEILDKMAGEFRSLYRHMAENSNAFLDENKDENASITENQSKLDKKSETSS